jgi:hypothetical protein
MKINILFLTLILISLSFVNAQDYQTVNSGRIAYFSNEYGNVNCLRIDSVKFQTDSILYPFPTIFYNEFGCISPYEASWLAKKIILKPGGDNLFLNAVFDTFLIKTNAQLNESWTAFTLPGSAIIKARVSKLDTMHFLGMIDSAKTIEFMVYDKNLTPLSHVLNNKSIVVSKNYGLVKTINFRLFPDFEFNSVTNEQLQESSLVGLSNPQTGIRNLSWFEVHDFQVGDEIHTFYQSVMWWIPENKVSEQMKTISRYLERTDYADSICYKIDRNQSLKKTGNSSVSYTYSHDTITSVIYPRQFWDKLPGEIIFSDHAISFNSMNNKTFLSKTESSAYTTYFFMSDSCWNFPNIDGCIPEGKYIKGLGGPYYECENFDSGGGTENTLVYYKKGSETWGTPLVITAIEENCLENEMEIYPNPAKDIIYVSVQNFGFPVEFELLNIEGQVVSDNKFTTGTFSVSCGNLKPGIYLYRLSREGGVVRSGKIVVE